MRRISSRLLLVLSLAAFYAMFAGYLFLFWLPQNSQFAENEIRDNALSHVETVAGAIAYPLFDGQVANVHEQLDEVLRNNPLWRSLIVTDARGRQVYPLPGTAQPSVAREAETLNAPILLRGESLGRIALVLDLGALYAARESQTRRLIGFLVAAGLGLGLAILLIFESLISRPVAQLTAAAERLARGDFDATLPTPGRTTMGRLTASFDHMRNEIRAQQTELHALIEDRKHAATALAKANADLDRRVQERTEEIARINRHLETEIHDRIRSQEELARSRNLLAAMLDNAPYNIFYRDLEGRTVIMNRAFREWFDKSLGRRGSGGRDREQGLSALDRRALETGDTEREEAVVADSAGRDHVFQITKFPVRDENGQIVGIGTISQDVTEIRRSEKQVEESQRLRVLGQLTGGIAHDFNNLLTVIMGNAEIKQLVLGQDDAELNAIIGAAQRGADFVHQLLAFSRRQTLQAATLDVNKLLAGHISMVRHTLRGNIKLVFAPTEGLWPVLADGSQLESAVLNLIINSRDVLPDGGTITIAARNRTLGQEIAAISGDLQPGDYVEISVQDTGDGIPPDILPRVFEPFFTTKEPGRGSGLGLSMVHGFASQSGGAAAIESVPGKGTKVSIFLPRDRSAPLQETENSRLTTEGTIGPRTILVLEDEADVLEMTVKMLKKLGHNAVAATRAEEALDYLRAGGKPDIMLSDVILGEEMTGPEFARLARQMLPEMKVAFMSGYTAEAFSRMPDGSTAFLLHKPFSLERLSIFIAEVLDKDPARLG